MRNLFEDFLLLCVSEVLREPTYSKYEGSLLHFVQFNLTMVLILNCLCFYVLRQS